VGKAKETLAINSNDEVFLELIDELGPGILKINGPFLYKVMPMRLT
jgi:DNA polymerase-3 subunit beta